MASIKVSCQNCGNIVEMGVGQHREGKRLVWSTGYACPFCGYQIEIDDEGMPPPEIRQAILAEEGEWELSVLDTTNTPRVLKALRLALDLSISETSELRKYIPGIVMSGTRLEMERIQFFCPNQISSLQFIKENTKRLSENRYRTKMVLQFG